MMAAKAKRQRVPVSERALVARVNRKLARGNQQLRRGRQEAIGRHDLGWFFVVDVNGNYIVEKDVDLEELGRRLEVLKGWEQLADD